MPNIFDDPEVKAAIAAAGVVHKPGIAQEVLRDLAPFLAEEGIDLNDPGDTDLETLNAALARATARYNQSLPPVGQPRREPAPARKSKRGKHTSGHPGQPKLSDSERSLVREFDRWLHRQPDIAAPSPGEESGMFSELLKAARHHGLNLRTPDGVEDLVTLLVHADEEDPSESFGPAIATLHDYIHFRMEAVRDPSAWDEIHDLVEDVLDDPLPGADLLEAAIIDTEQLDPDERRAALAQTQLVANVTELLDWIGTGRGVAPSGGVRRADIAYAAGLLGIAAIGVDKLPPFAPDSPPLIEIEPKPSAPTAIHARSMMDVPLLPSWWTALASAEVIEVVRTRVRPGPSAADWTAESLPPLELAEMVAGMTVCHFVCEDLENRSAHFADRVAAITLGRLLWALAPDQVEPPRYEDEFDQLLDGNATRRLQRLEHVGVLAPDAKGDFVVPHALRGAVARGVFAALTVLGGAFETD